MIQLNSIKRCLDIIQFFLTNDNVPKDKKELYLTELEGVLKHEYEIVESFHENAQTINNPNISRTSTQEILKDNIQLFNENVKLIKSINKLKEILYEKVVNIEQQITKLYNNV